MPWIANRGLCEAEAYIPEPNTVCVSITEPKNWRGYGILADLKDGYDDILRMKFEDYDSERLHPPDAALFTKEQAEEIVGFVTKHRGKNILVHCSAGISRSGAIVDSLLQAFPEYEDQGNKRFPNGHVKRLMKRALGLVPLGFCKLAETDLDVVEYGEILEQTDTCVTVRLDPRFAQDKFDDCLREVPHDQITRI